MQVYLSGYDITKYVISSNISFDVNFPSFNSNSVISGQNIEISISKKNIIKEIFFSNGFIKRDIKIYSNEYLIFDGFANEIKQTNYTFTISAIDFIYSLSDRELTFFSSNKTPAEIVKNILVYYLNSNQINMIDNESFSKAINSQEQNSVFAVVNASALSGISIITAIQNLCDISLMTIYFENGLIKCLDYGYLASITNHLSSLLITNNDITSDIEITETSENVFDGYSISYASGVAGFNTDGKSVKSISFNSSNEVYLSNNLSAYYLGESYLELGKKNKELKFKLLYKYRLLIRLGCVINYGDENYYVYKIAYNDEDRISFDVVAKRV